MCLNTKRTLQHKGDVMMRELLQVGGALLCAGVGGFFVGLALYIWKSGPRWKNRLIDQ